MANIPTPTLVLSREEWTDADFDLPDGVPIHAPSDKDDEGEDWDLEMDFGQTGGAKAQAVVAGMVARSEAAAKSFSSFSQTITIRPPLEIHDVDEEDDEGVSTIKATAFPVTLIPKVPKQPLPPTIDEDFEDAFALPSDLTKLSLAPISLSHRSSKQSLEWGDKDNSSSSQSSDAYSTLGFADIYPSSNSTSSASSGSLPETETEDDEDELDGLVIPSALFESKQSARQLNKILESKKKADLTNHQVKVATPNPEEDFEAGLIIEDDVDLSPSRLIYNTQNNSQRGFNRSNSHPPQRPSALRPPSRAKLERSKSPAHPPLSSTRQLQKIRLSPSPPLRPPSRSQTFQALAAPPPPPPPPIPSPTPSPSSSFLSPKPGSLRGQKSHSGLKPPTPPSTARKLTRKASMSVIESSSKMGSLSSSEATTSQGKSSRYDEPTAASKAKSHKSSTSRIRDFKVPPTRPCTPSANPAALRLTMPTQSKSKSRPALSQVFGLAPDLPPHSATRATSPIPPPRPPSSMSLRAASRAAKAPLPPVPTPPPVAAPKLLRKPKRLKTYGDGTELDAIDDLPLDQEKEGRFRVQPKGYGNRIPGATYDKDKTLFKSVEKSTDRSTIRKSKWEGSPGHEPTPLASATNTLKRTARIDFPTKLPPASEVLPKKRKNASSPAGTRRKPTLIRNLGGAGGPKVVGDMKWNPVTLRWEGNDQVLRDFDSAVGTSMRPALITQLTGSSIGSPSGSFANGARVVGNMFFDPNQMRWISTLPPEEDEPDVFANLADDEEDEDAWDSKAATIRASAQPSRVSDASSTATSTSNSNDSSDTRLGAISPSHSHSRTISDSGSDRGSRASMVCDVDEAFVERCRQAEQRHRSEMKGWKNTLSKYEPYLGHDRSYLFEIRALATRKY